MSIVTFILKINNKPNNNVKYDEDDDEWKQV